MEGGGRGGGGEGKGCGGGGGGEGGGGGGAMHSLSFLLIIENIKEGGGEKVQCTPLPFC